MHPRLVIPLVAVLGCGGATTATPPADTPANTPPSETTPATTSEVEMEPLDLRTPWDWSDMPGTRATFEGLLDDPRAAEPDVRAEVLTQIARTHGLEGDYDTARARLDEAAASMTADGLGAIRHALELGRVHNSSGDPEGSLEHFHRAADLAEAHGEAEGLYVDALHMLGIAAPSDEALQWNLRAIEYAEASSDEDARRWLGPLLNNVGWTYFDLGDLDSALDLLQRSLAWRQERGAQPGIWIAEWSVARIFRAQGRHDDAFAIQTRLRDEREAAGEPGGYVFEELGELYTEADEAEAACTNFAHAWALLSQDAWMMEHEAERMARIQQLGDCDL